MFRHLEIIVLSRNKLEVRKRPILSSTLLNRRVPSLESTRPASYDDSPTLHMVTPPEIWIKRTKTSSSNLRHREQRHGNKRLGARLAEQRTKLTTPKVLGRHGAGRGGLSDCVSGNTDSRSIQVVVTCLPLPSGTRYTHTQSMYKQTQKLMLVISP